MPPDLSPFPWFDLCIIFALVLLNGVFAMSELAIVSSRRARLQAMVKDGRPGAQTAIDLASQPGRFLSTVQIGITLIGILAGAYSGASLGGPVGDRLAFLGVEPSLAQTLGFALVIILTTYASLVIGELVPKQLALRNPERVAVVVALPMRWLARFTAPLVWLMDRTSALIFRLLRMSRNPQSRVTAEELHMLVAEATKSGVIEESERAIISGVVRLADRPVREVMTPRTEVDWIEASSSPNEIREALLATPHTRLPVAEGSVDEIIGVVQARDIVSALFEGRSLDLRELMREAPIVPDQVDAMDALEALRESDVPMALVHDEYGHFEGLMTPLDLLIAVAGEFVSDQEVGTDPAFVERADGSWLLSGSLSADNMAEKLGVDLPEDRDYATVAGFALSVLKRLPTTGELFERDGWRFEVVDMDGRKIDKLLAQRSRATDRP
ncbi:HlyC/CorC family transporter [Parasphingopyxis algicola]|uniref:hemolysin family protein n=1 Tax=Parasphingopyxis algicola TaxID=2026624 RepID=UPI0015A32680|nr:hemolysin family protein [Parasphingopyxis algicola]QLC25319.1 HlyC/CorC family transporter [Parasphingopyxis algicola]